MKTSHGTAASALHLFNKQTRSRRSVILLPAAISALLLFSGAAFAQDNVGDESTIDYPASYFAEWGPVTALDMINRIPGMNIADTSGQTRGNSAVRGGRGLGSGGNGGTTILINGKRTAGKNNNTQSLLSRISADQVERIELIRGTSGDLDVRGSTQIANILLFDELPETSLSYELGGSYYEDSQSEPSGSLSYSGQTGGLNFLVGAIAEPRYDHKVSRENSILGDFLPNDQVFEDRVTDQTQYTLSTNLGYEFGANSSARINALYSENDNPVEVDRTTIDLRNLGSFPYIEREFIPGEQSNWEVGGDYEYRFASGSRAKVLFITNENDTASIRERFVIGENGDEAKNLFLDSSNILQERIVRGSFTTDIFVDQSVEMGVELAQTILDSKLRLGLPSAIGIPSAEYGGLVAQDVPNANTRVEETRYEPFAIHNWRINSRMSLETSLVYEFSEIEQSGDISNTRDFSFFKPKFDYRFDITPQLQLRVLVEKFVRQINFTDFVAATDATDDDSNTQAGNAELEPDYWWNYNFLAEYRLPNDVGVISANYYWHHHKDFLQRIDVSPSPDNIQSANGNIGTGDMQVFELKGSIRLGMFNMPNVLVTSLASVRDSEFTDPFLDIERRFNNYHRGEFNIGFRHDIPQWKVNWGANLINRFDGGTKRWDIDDIENYYADPWVTAFAEVIAFDDITVRFDLRNVTDVDRCRDRTRYVGHIADDILEEIEYNCGGSGQVYSLKVSGTF